MPIHQGRVIITHGRGLMALVSAHSLDKKGIEVYGCDSVDYTLLSFSKSVKEYFLCPDFRKDEKGYIDFMLEKVKTLQPKDDRPYVLMPMFKETRLFAKHKKRFEPYIKIAAPDFEAIKKVHPKNHLAETLKELEVSAPETWLPENEDDLRKMAKNELTFPVLIKPYDQSSGRGIHKVEDQDELLKYYQENHEKFGQQSLIQNIVKGKEYCYCALYDHGEKKAGMAYQNLFTFPPASGPGAMRETIDSKVFAEVADPLMRKLNWNGVAEFDFFWNGDDESLPKLIEVNGRLWGGLFQSVESGIDFPWLLFLLTADGSVNTSQTAEIGTKTKLPGTWMISALHDIIVNDENANEIEQKGQAALQSLKDGEILDGLKEFGSYLQAHINEKKNRIEAVTELGRAARSQVLDTDDPLAGWGFLFILSSLLRHGELPKEVRF